MRKLWAVAACLTVALSFTACGGAPSAGSSSASATEAATHTVQHEKGTATVPTHPKRIVSTSVVLTGTLLALDAPVIGSGGSKPNAIGLDSHGWWKHWSSIAEQRGVQSLFTSGNLDLETVTAAKPDVIIVAATGGDSFVDKYDQLNQIAPTLVVDYNNHTWEDVTKTLGADLNLQSKADAVLKDFDATVADAKGKIKAPTAPVDLAVYGGDGKLSVGLPTAPQAKILNQLGIQTTNTGVTPEKGRTDFAFTTPEQANQALTAQQMLLAGNDENDRTKLFSDAAFANIPSIKNHDVKVLGIPSFKLDYYAAKDLVAHVVDAYPAS